jgi:hypothetical protein
MTNSTDRSDANRGLESQDTLTPWQRATSPDATVEEKEAVDRWLAKEAITVGVTINGTPGIGKSSAFAAHIRPHAARKWVYARNYGKKRMIRLPPAHMLASAAKFLLTEMAYRRFVQPAIADMHYEYFRAIKAGETWHARWISARVWFQVVPGFLYAAVVRAVKALFIT